MTLLLTGATGFLGSHLLKALCKEGYRVVVLKRSGSDVSRIAEVLPQCKAYNIDQIDIAAIFAEKAIDAVIHCATVYGRQGSHPAEVLEGNVLFPLRLLDAAIQAQCRWFINTDTFFCKQIPERLEQGRPLYLPDYTLSKYQFREWGKQKAAEDAITFINLQMEHIYGPDDGPGKFVPWLEQQFREGAPYVNLTDGIQLRDFIPVEDAVCAYLGVLENLQTIHGYQSFEVGTGETMSVRQFVEALKERYAAKTELRFGALPRKATEIMYSTAQTSWDDLTNLKRISKPT